MKQQEVWPIVHTLDKNHLAEALCHNDARVRKIAAERIGILRDAKKVHQLISCLALESDGDVALAIIRAMDRIGKPAIHPLILGLTDKNAKIRWASVRSLGGMGCSGAIRNLCKTTRDKDLHVRSASVNALGSIRILNKKVEAEILNCLDDDDDGIVLNAIYSAGRLGCDSAVPQLISQLETATPYIKRYIIESLGEIGDCQATSPLVQLLIKNECMNGIDLTNEDSQTVLEIVNALRKIADSHAVNSLVNVLICYVTLNKDTAARPAEEGCDPGCTERESPVPPHIIENISAALIKIGDPAIVPLIEALQTWAETEEGENDLPVYSCCEPVSLTTEICYILSKLGPSVIEQIMTLLHDEKSAVRKTAITFLGRHHLTDTRVLEALTTSLITDTDCDVRTKAAWFLGEGGSDSFDSIISNLEPLHRPFTLEEVRAMKRMGEKALDSLTLRLYESDDADRSKSVDTLRELIKISEPESGMRGLGALFG